METKREGSWQIKTKKQTEVAESVLQRTSKTRPASNRDKQEEGEEEEEESRKQKKTGIDMKPSLELRRKPKLDSQSQMADSKDLNGQTRASHSETDHQDLDGPVLRNPGRLRVK